jgi:6-pyruvoyltetrahydropterin/6-carboxytetrahydropterin synthase
MYILKKTFGFEASHQLMQHDGKCRRLHGHSWKITIEIAAADLQSEGPQTNMVMDFQDISNAVKPLIDEYFDHHHLNDTLGTESPTTEFIARWTYDRLKNTILPLRAVIVHETCTSECRYEGQ